jgi:hypothetical protein
MLKVNEIKGDEKKQARREHGVQNKRIPSFSRELKSKLKPDGGYGLNRCGSTWKQIEGSCKQGRSICGHKQSGEFLDCLTNLRITYTSDYFSEALQHNAGHGLNILEVS